MQNPDLVALLERVLADAQAGRLTGLGLVAIMPVPGSLTATIAIETRGDQVALLAGAAQMQRQILETMFPKTAGAMEHPFRTARLSS